MKTKYLFTIALTSLLMASCSEDTMDRINEDKAHPEAGAVNAKYQLTDAEVATAYSVVNGAYAWYVSSYTEQLFGTGNNQLKNAELRQIGETAAASTFNNEWNATYLNLFNLNQIKAKCAEGGVSDGQYDILGMAQTLEALNWGVLTDLHGDVPFSECFSNISAPKVDKQEDIYKAIINLLDEAIANFATGEKNAGSQDILFGGDLDKWTGFAHALKARYLLHTYGRNNNVLNEVLTEANAAIAAGFDGVALDVFNGVTADNSWSAYWWSREYNGSSTTVDDLLLARNDPREAIYNCDYWEYDIVGEPGNSDMAMATEVINIPQWLDNGAAPLHLFSKAELYFIIAEAKARLGQDAAAEFQEGVLASIADYSDNGAVYYGAISDADAADYLTSLQARFDADPLSEILIQKYIAQARDEQIETYNDIRRCLYVDGSYPVTLTNPNNTSSAGNRWPLRLPYGESDVQSNPNVAAAFGSGSEAGNYIFTENVWWAGGSR
ncbi:MAG: SusD/RagB family nutrient-binding outer membrane lipoprotein [Prevotella sp.]|nr:SusD/RagB family nutrient-binding outer membrane lipoprotein [Prevotella sp.]